MSNLKRLLALVMPFRWWIAFAVLLSFGSLGATVGLTPVFWSVGACLATGGWLYKRAV